MIKSKNSSDKIFVVGASSVLSYELSIKFTGVIFLGKTNPYNLDGWVKIDTLDSTEGITRSTQALVSELEKRALSTDYIHLVLLQGISSPNWQESLNVNLVSVAEMAEAFSEWVKRKDKLGSITMIGSAAAFLGGKPQYASTKAALHGLMHSLSGNHSPYVRSNIVLPGVFKGRMVADWDNEKIHKINQKTHAGRFGEPEEIADAIKFAITNQYISGSIINMSNGQVK